MRDDKKLIALLRTAAGQIEGIERMLTEKKSLEFQRELNERV